MGRISEEKETVSKMIQLYCSKNHGTVDGLCEECSALRTYAFKRLELCPFGDDKSTCGKCKIHCYNSKHRDNIREVMKFSGPRMLIYEPRLAFRHLAESLK